MSAKLIYANNVSLDGFYVDSDGAFDFTEPVPELHDWYAEMEQGIGTHLYGRRLWETMAVWEEFALQPDLDPLYRRFAEAWVDTDHVVYSRTLTAVDAPKARLVASFDPAEVAALKATATRNLEIGGAELAGQALAAGLVDEVVLAVAPIILGGGRHALPHGTRQALRLAESVEFSDGTVLVRYDIGA